ncbi:3274_t:CDS:2 [Ambispora gerdemannii]|uniref:3274_t:CDS:1 n=1 Tax=Ambispora gerdemannii TaxID=144530 RepID=A0A9N9D7L8_9GLOM|nr:3274_t:CDS:2 [Ambispora gerdemannii]
MSDHAENEQSTNNPENEYQDVHGKEKVHSVESAKVENLSEDELFEDLENDDFVVSNFREKRLEQLKKEMQQLQEMRASDHGTLTEVTEEKEVLKITTSTKNCVVHFFHKEFRRCQIMDKHLKILAQKHFKTRFLKIDVENAPFLVEKLNVQVLPCVICFIDGISVDRIVGFDELGNTDSFNTGILEVRLSTSGVIIKAKEPEQDTQRKTIFGFSNTQHNDDDDWD